MPRRDDLLTWNAKQSRWFKRRNKRQFAVSCKVLSEDYPHLFQSATKEGSYRAANQWWADKVAELGREQVSPQEAWRRIIEENDPEPAGPGSAQYVLNAIEGGYLKFEGHGSEIADYVNAVREKCKPVQKKSSIAYGVKSFIATKRAEIATGGISIGRFDALRRSCEYFAKWLVEDTAMSSINGAVLSTFRTHLLERMTENKPGQKRFSAAYAAGYMSDCQQLVEWLYQNDLLPLLPKNLRSTSLQIHVGKKKILTYSLDEAKAIIAASPTDRTRLYLYLSLNTSMLQADISDIRHDEVDWKAGTITRKRTKTDDEETVPTVTYPLWPETLQLLKQEATSGRGRERVLLNEDGKPLKDESIGAGDVRRKQDAIRSAWRRIKKSGVKHNGRSFKHFRKTSATLLRDSEWQELRHQWLGQASPASIADKHYSDAPEKRMRAAVSYLREQYLGTPKPR